MSIINASTSGGGGLITTADASGQLELQTAGIAALIVNSSQVASFTNNFGTVAGYPAYQCRAWVNFNGTGTVAIRASGNVTSITDGGVGIYTVNFTNAMPDINYSFMNNGIVAGVTATRIAGQVVNSSSAIIYTSNAAGTLADASEVYAAVFR